MSRVTVAENAEGYGERKWTMAAKGSRDDWGYDGRESVSSLGIQHAFVSVGHS